MSTGEYQLWVHGEQNRVAIKYVDGGRRFWKSKRLRSPHRPGEATDSFNVARVDLVVSLVVRGCFPTTTEIIAHTRAQSWMG